MTRGDELATNLAAVHSRIESACATASRDPHAVRLVVVTKFFPASDVRILAALGVTDVGENLHQEAARKAEECADLGLVWHFIGGLQSNKAAAVAGYADVVESVDRVKLVRRLNEGAHERSRPLDCLVQVSLDEADERGRSGVPPAGVSALADEIDAADRLTLRGLMAIAPLDAEPRSAFGRLAEIRAELLAERPEAAWLSAGMSGDLEEAVEAGATHVRVGSAILGPRPLIK